jgi:hypothetical protein
MCLLCKTAAAQYPDVSDEPYHMPIFGHDCFRYLNVSANPGDTTNYHVHRNPILYLTIMGSEVWLDEASREPRTVKLSTGWTGSDGYGNGDTLLHRFAVVGDSPLHIIAVEIIGTCANVDHPPTDPFYQEHGFSVYELDWASYMDGGYFEKFPAVVPPFPIHREGWVTYGAGYLIRPSEEGYMPPPGVEVVYIVLPTKE